MDLRSFRTILLCICLLGMVLLSGVWAVRASTPSTHPSHSFLPSGHGIAVPQMVNTASLPHVQSAGSGGMGFPSSAAPGRPAPVLAPQQPHQALNVVNVPAPTKIDPGAKAGIAHQGGKPDPSGTGDVSNYLETTDSGLAIYSRGGVLQMKSTYQTWFNVNSPFYDPVTTMDNTEHRLIFSVLQTSAAFIWVSVALQSSAQGLFCNYSFPTPSGQDFDKLGVDSDGIYFSVNVLAPGTNNVVSNELFFASRLSLENCQKVIYTDWIGLTNPDGTIAAAITPARQDSSAGGVEYLVNSVPAGACQLTLWTLTSGGTLTNASVATQCYSPPTQAKQKGSPALINTGDCSITQASYVNGLLTVDTPGSFDFGDGNGPVSIVEWYVLNPSTASVSNQGAFGTPGYWLFFPSTITTANGHMLFVYSASGPTIYPSVWFVNQTLTNSRALVNGTSSFGTTGVSPWGAYQSAWPDVNSGFPNSVWITGEYAKSTNGWGTAFDLITP